jgi:hypothetical protein
MFKPIRSQFIHFLVKLYGTPTKFFTGGFTVSTTAKIYLAYQRTCLSVSHFIKIAIAAIQDAYEMQHSLDEDV